ncbi:MAG: DinB family protein [Candidatus Heimdallarchaeota archaeon]|nr:DinB family protein [Candidatus Heimdallarchaeota archaeon]MDH5644833.1 DinB family protein [Candidatus Heimdallarchaeota archaeon]
MLKDFFAWNMWANDRYREKLSEISIVELKVDTPYGKLLDRIIHIFASYEMWYLRMEGKSPNKVLNSSDFISWDAISSTWKNYDKLLLDFVEVLSPEDINRIVSYTSMDGTIYKRKIKHILMHLISHPNYHRGQISAIFKYLNLPALPSTDMVIYFLDHS